MRNLQVIEDGIRELRDRGTRFLEAVHVDGRRFQGEFVGLHDTANGRQLVLKSPDGAEIHLYYATIRRLVY
jgi:hypothetical protein